ncbi:hypothetical protein ACSNOI_27265 [Actinomadura kijaniata]|uniref:hypothetical protein n=1 Tax=Actinomadura kijaniata TaxID=46161 RepID=UPI003F19B474
MLRRTGRPARVRVLLTAARLGCDADLRHTAFGPAGVAVHQVGIAEVRSRV